MPLELLENPLQLLHRRRVIGGWTLDDFLARPLQGPDARGRQYLQVLKARLACTLSRVGRAVLAAGWNTGGGGCRQNGGRHEPDSQ